MCACVWRESEREREQEKKIEKERKRERAMERERGSCTADSFFAKEPLIIGLFCGK